MSLIQSIYDIWENPTILGVCTGMVLFFGPIWVAFLVGVVVGWAWKPKWASLGREELCCSLAKSLDWCSASSSPSKPVFSSLKGSELQSPNPEPLVLNKGMGKVKRPSSSPPTEYDSSSRKISHFVVLCSTSATNEETANTVTLEDLQHLWQLVEVKDGGPPWMQMMDRETPNMSYQAWRRDPKEGPPQYRSRTVFEDATPEIVRDFFLDDEFRPRWDDMLARATTLEECPTTGTTKVQWIRKFPFFCKDREYIIARRVWESGRSYYCVTKGVDCPSVPRQDKPRRVDVYYSSWCIRAVESRRAKDQLTACEVMLFHHEEMGIPWEIAKLGVRKGMWSLVQKIEPGLRAYQHARASGEPISRSAYMAQINTKINPAYLQSLGGSDDQSETESVTTVEKPQGVNIPKMLILGGAVALACSLDKGLMTKTLIFGVARRVANLGRR
ncbi:StAR-related lipid transfer protein 7, mitochondrial [Senna tora]|uniref:StAR-related lipid transfer protein 7, mitochondrial n=1 Tax=Senna tora TaxID=362788 RepID=A0A834T7R0_9FABA|nr:StAR-related lipid transfer protein 7, mitochondrial [Senna tora]